MQQELFKTLGTLLRESRERNGFSQKEISSRLGYSSPQFISNIERGLCAPPLNKLKDLIDVYELNPDKVVRLILKEEKRKLEGALLRRRRTRS